jgi:hypothetical protein
MKASKTVAAIEVIYYALNKMSFFASSSKTISALTRARIRVNIRNNDSIKFRSSFN